MLTKETLGQAEGCWPAVAGSRQPARGPVRRTAAELPLPAVPNSPAQTWRAGAGLTQPRPERQPGVALTLLRRRPHTKGKGRLGGAGSPAPLPAAPAPPPGAGLRGAGRGWREGAGGAASRRATVSQAGARGGAGEVRLACGEGPPLPRDTHRGGGPAAGAGRGCGDRWGRRSSARCRVGEGRNVLRPPG